MTRALVLTATAVVLAGCGSKQASTLSASVGQKLTLPPSAVGAPFVEFDRGKQGFAYRGPGLRGDPRRFHRIGGWVARYRRSGTRTTMGPLVIDSNAELFADAAGAKRDLEALRAEIGQLYPKPVSVPRLGDESFARTLKTGSGNFAVRYYIVAWRDRNVAAILSVNGFDGRVALHDALRLAQTQERRIAAIR